VRVVVPGLPHHVTQRGNRREPVFFGAGDYQLYRRLIAAAARRAGAEIWAYCLMPNHVHLIVTPTDHDGLRATFAEAHRRYTGAINARFQWTGHLFQGRFGAVVMDAPHLLAATRYIALNPVAAGLVSRAEDWPWSSARAHLAGEDDELATVAPLRGLSPILLRFSRHRPIPRRRLGSSGHRQSDGRLARRNGSRRSSGSSAGAWHPANRAQSPEWTGTSAATAAAVRTQVNCHRNFP
jgi:REP element-mobilizing transposase RayT